MDEGRQNGGKPSQKVVPECVQMKKMHAKFRASKSTTKREIILIFKNEVYENTFLITALHV